MSKTGTSLPLLAILRFNIPSNSTRTLNATQAYDTTPSGVTLGSFLGTLVDNAAAVKAEIKPANVNVGLSLTTTGANIVPGLGAEKQSSPAIAGSSATLSVGTTTACVPINACASQTLTYQGTTTNITPAGGVSNKSKATNPNTTFYGAITVGTGDYKKWQGNYAVLKINTSIGKGVMRIYDA